MASDALLLGRLTYEEFAPVWPHVEGEFADKFNSMPKHVVSSTLGDPEWSNTTVLTGEVVDVEHDLVDALHLLVYPVIVGAGKRLYDGTSETKRLQLVGTRTFADGVHLLVYRRATLTRENTKPRV